MKDYLNLFHKIISDVDTWDKMDTKKKSIFFENIIGKDANQTFFIDYFDKYETFLTNCYSISIDTEKQFLEAQKRFIT